MKTKKKANKNIIKKKKKQEFDHRPEHEFDPNRLLSIDQIRR